MTTVTAAPAVHPPTAVSETAALAMVKPGAVTSITEVVWTQDRIDLIKRMKCPPDTTDDEFAIFLMQCKRTGMDPLIDEADCVPRGKFVQTKKKGTNGKDYWEDVWTVQKVFQPRESGMRARADRFPDYRGIKYGVVREGDVFEFEPSNFHVKHVSNPADPKRQSKPIMGAWAQITREGRQCVPIWLPIAERLQMKKDGAVTQMWTTKQETMMAKCARAEAFRIEYPNTFAGQYIVEEWEQDEREINAAPDQGTATSSPPATKTDQVLQKVQAQVDALKGKKAQPEDEQIVQPPAPVPPAAATAKPRDPKKGRVPGTFREKPISDMTAEQMTAALDETEKWLTQHPLVPEAPVVRATLDDLQQEQSRRIAASMDKQAREPGQDFDFDQPSDEDAPF